MIKIRVVPITPKLLNKIKNIITNVHAAQNNRNANIIYNKNSIAVSNCLLVIQKELPHIFLMYRILTSHQFPYPVFQFHDFYRMDFGNERQESYE